MTDQTEPVTLTPEEASALARFFRKHPDATEYGADDGLLMSIQAKVGVYAPEDSP